MATQARIWVFRQGLGDVHRPDFDTQVRLWLLRQESGYSGKVQVTCIGQTPTTQVRLWLLRQESGYAGKVQATYIHRLDSDNAGQIMASHYAGKNLATQARLWRRT